MASTQESVYRYKTSSCFNSPLSIRQQVRQNVGCCLESWLANLPVAGRQGAKYWIIGRLGMRRVWLCGATVRMGNRLCGRIYVSPAISDQQRPPGRPSHQVSSHPGSGVSLSETILLSSNPGGELLLWNKVSAILAASCLALSETKQVLTTSRGPSHWGISRMQI